VVSLVPNLQRKKTEWLGTTILFNDKSRLKGYIKQIGFQFSLNTDLTNSGRLFHTGGLVTDFVRQTLFLSVNNEVEAAGRIKTLTYWVAADWLNRFT